MIYEIFDMDGTLSDVSHRKHFIEGDKKDWNSFYEAAVNDPPHKAIIELFRSVASSNTFCYVCTGRPEAYRSLTSDWHNRYVRWNYAGLLMRKDGDYRPDVEVKKEMLDSLEDQSGYLPVFAVDDRESMVKAWWSWGVPCLHFNSDLRLTGGAV